MRKWNWNLIVDALILAAVIVVGWQGRPVQAQLAGSSGFTYTPITTATNTQVKSAQGTLHNLVIGGGTLTGNITIVDTSAANCTGGTTITTITQPETVGQTFTFDLQFNNGLCITTAAAVTAVVDWR